jgi:hypothetical protein
VRGEMEERFYRTAGVVGDLNLTADMRSAP